MFEFKSKNYYYLLYLYYQILKDLGIFDKKLIITERKIENLKEKINELFERNQTLNKKKYTDLFMMKNAKKTLKESMANIDIYYLLHIFIYLYKCMYSTDSKSDYNKILDIATGYLYMNNKKDLINQIITIYGHNFKDDETLSKLYLFIFLSKTADNKDELTKYFNFVFNNLITILRSFKNLVVSIKYLFIINYNYDTFLQIFKAIYPNPGNMKITYDLTERISTISRSINKEETEKQVIFDFLFKDGLSNIFVSEQTYKEIIINRLLNQSTKEVYLPPYLLMMKRILLLYMETYLFNYYDNSLYLTLNKSQKSLVKQILMRIDFMLKEENYDTPEFINSFNFLLSNKYTINPILYTVINIVYSYYKNKETNTEFNDNITKELYDIYYKYSDKDLHEKNLFDTSVQTLTYEDREFLVQINRSMRGADYLHEIRKLSFDNKIILFIQLLKSLYKKELLTNKDLYNYYSLFKSQRFNIKKQKEKKPLTYSVSKTKKLSTAAVNRYPAISERLKSFPMSPSKSPPKSSTRN